MLAAVMHYIHGQPTPSSAYSQLSFLPFDWCRIYGLARLAFLDYGLYSTLRHWQIGQLHEIASFSYTRVPTEMVYFHYFIWLLHGRSAYRWCRLITHFYGVEPSLGYNGQPVNKVTSMDSSYLSVSFLMCSVSFL